MMKKQRRKTGNLRRVIGMMLPHWTALLLCAGCVLLVNLSELAKPYIQKIIMDDFLLGDAVQRGLYSVTGMSILYLIAVVLASVMTIIQANVMNGVAQRIMMQLRHRVFKHIQLMPLRLLDKFSAGRLITRATNDVEALNELFTDVVLNLFKDIFLLIGLVFVMVQLDWRLALLSFTALPVIGVFVFLVRTKLRRNFQIVKSLIGQINGFFAENISGMRLVQIFNRQKEKYQEFKKLNERYYKGTLIQITLNSLMMPVIEIINNLVLALLIWWGLGKMGVGTLALGTLYAFTNYVKQFFQPISDLAEKYNTIQSASVSADRIYELLDQEDQQERLDQGDPVERFLGEVTFEHVWFAYTRDQWVLKDVSFVIKPGQRVAFVGATGAGKTTIISLITRFYDIQRGRILIDGKDIRTMRLRDLRRYVSVVLQDVFLFSGTIAENVRLNSPIPDERVEQALELSCARGFIDELPGGMAHPVTERGSTFSAGQRQLLSFARAIAHDPAVFVLDEATANIDTRTEMLIQQSINNVSAGRTTIIIAHRLSTIRACDQIMVMDHGRLMEQGTHEELLEQGGIYAHLHEAQFTLMQHEAS
ncbi:MAG: ABC transporter ATP-binding protein [Christensenellales bacterium]|jgi:ATP-binding cassette subfamily B multidrug efflux pump